MGNSNLGNKQCPHGNCLDHGPSWENIGDPQVVRNPGAFGLRVYFIRWHCGKPMERFVRVRHQKCRQCGRTRTERLSEANLAVCSCCGYHEEVFNISGD